MIVDSSAIVAILLRERGSERLFDILAEEDAAVGAPTLVEAGIVLEARRGTAGRTLLGRLVEEANLAVVPFEKEHWQEAVSAFARFGRGRHPARLNFGDCLTYAVARLADEPLLCLGDDFAQTDLEIAVA